MYFLKTKMIKSKKILLASLHRDPLKPDAHVHAAFAQVPPFSHGAHVVSSTDNYKEVDQNIIKLKKNLSIHFSRRNLKCMNDRNSMFDDCHISQIHGQVVVRILRKQEILKLKTKMRIFLSH